MHAVGPQRADYKLLVNNTRKRKTYMKTASASAQKFVERAGAASGDYVSGPATSNKDQSAAAIAAKANYQAGLQASFTRGAYEKGLQQVR